MSVWVREIKRKDGTVERIWYGRVYQPTGKRDKSGKPSYKQIKFSLGLNADEVSEKKALREFSFKLSEVLQSNPPRESDLTIETFEDEYLEHVKTVKKKKSWDRDELSIKHLKRTFRKEGRAIPLEQIKASDLLNHQEVRLGEGAANATINRELACLRHMINIAIVKDRFSKQSPFRRFEFLKEPNNKDRVLEPHEEKALFSQLLYHQAVLIDLLTNTAMRATESITLKWNKVNFEVREITIMLSHVKGEIKTKKIKMNDYVFNLLWNHYEVTGHQEYVILSPVGEPYKDKHSLKFFVRACKRANIKGVTLHTLRHTAITRMLGSNSPIDSVARIAGHQKISTTMGYAHSNPADQMAVDSLMKYRKEPLGVRSDEEAPHYISNIIGNNYRKAKGSE